MSRAPSHPDSLAASLLVDLIEDEPERLPGGRWLVVGDPAQHVARPLSAAGHEVVTWCRVAQGDAPATAWPPEGPFQAATIRLPRDRRAFEMALHLVAARLAPGAPIYVYGHNDEGARSVKKPLAAVFEAPTTLDTRRHCRLWKAVRDEREVRGTPEAWRQTTELDLPGAGPVTLTAWPGVFAKGGLDPASAMLLEALVALPHDAMPPSRLEVLDFACGLGVLALGVRARWPSARLQLLEADAVAAEAARLNVPDAHLIVGDGAHALETTGTGRWHLIVSNPPIHSGRAMDLSVTHALMRLAGARLAPGGRLIMVIQRQRPVAAELKAAGLEVEQLAGDGRFTVWSGLKKRSAR